MFNKAAAFQRLQQILSDKLGVPLQAITQNTSMDNLPQWDSLQFLLIIDQVEKEFGFRFKRDQLLNLRSVQDFIDNIQANTGKE